MENAAKALLIAGGVLIAILILSLFSYLVTQMGGSTSKIYSTMSQKEITEFNQKFLNYEDRELNIQDVITIVNMAKDNNEKSNRNTTISVFVGGQNWVNKTSNQLNDLIKEKLEVKYQCKQVLINQSSLLVERVDIQ